MSNADYMLSLPSDFNYKVCYYLDNYNGNDKEDGVTLENIL